MLDTILYILALVFCVLGFLGVPRFNWWYGVAACLIAAQWLV